MDPDDRLTEELGEELRRSMAEMRLHPEFRADLKGRLLAAPEIRWRRWLSSWPAVARHRGALATVVVAAIAAAVVIPLATSPHSQLSTGRSYLVIVPPAVSGGHAADAAPAICPSGNVQLSVSPAQAALAPGQRATFVVSETGSSCPLTATVRGPSAAGLSIMAIPQRSPEPLGPANAMYQLLWTGRTTTSGSGSGTASGAGAKGAAELSPGTYTVTLSVPSSRARASISITISS